MRGSQDSRGRMFSDISLEERVPAAHPLRKLRAVVDALLATMDREFEAVYARRGRPSVPPEMLLKVPPARRRRTHESTTDADTRLFKKSPGDKGDDCKAFNSAPTPAREISASRGGGRPFCPPTPAQVAGAPSGRMRNHSAYSAGTNSSVIAVPTATPPMST